MCLEFSQVNPPLLRSMYDFYSFNFIPVWGQLIANDYNSYQYPIIHHHPKYTFFDIKTDIWWKV